MPEHDEEVDAPKDVHQHHDGKWHSDCPQCIARRQSKMERWGVEDKVVDSETK